MSANSNETHRALILGSTKGQFMVQAAEGCFIQNPDIKDQVKTAHLDNGVNMRIMDHDFNRLQRAPSQLDAVIVTCSYDDIKSVNDAVNMMKNDGFDLMGDNVKRMLVVTNIGSQNSLQETSENQSVIDKLEKLKLSGKSLFVEVNIKDNSSVMAALTKLSIAIDPTIAYRNTTEDKKEDDNSKSCSIM